jgi:hypothetical protein
VRLDKVDLSAVAFYLKVATVSTFPSMEEEPPVMLPMHFWKISVESALIGAFELTVVPIVESNF